MKPKCIHPILSALALAAFATGAVAQDRSVLLTNIEVNQLAASGTPADDQRLRDHFAALAARYEADARKHRAMAQVMPGNPSHPFGISPGWYLLRLAATDEKIAATLRELSAYYGDLAAGHPSTAPPDSTRFERGEGSPEPSDAQIRELIVRARTPADHRNLEEYFNTRAEQYTNAAERYAVFAQMYRGEPRRTIGGDPTVHYDRMATRYRDLANDARAEAARQRQLAQVG